MKKISPKSVVNVLSTCLVYLFVILGLLAVILTVTAKKSKDGTAEIFGYQMRVVLSPSMEKCALTDVSSYPIRDIPVGSMVFVRSVPEDGSEALAWYSELKVGDVLTFRYVVTAKQETITHRITKIEPKEGGYVITLAGDNKNSEDGALEQVIDTTESLTSPNFVLGKVVGQSRALGKVVNLMTQKKIALFLLLIVPCAVIIVFEVLKIVDAVRSEKSEEEKEKKDSQQSELEELKRQLEILRRQTESMLFDPPGTPDPTESIEPTKSTESTESSEPTGQEGS